MQQTFDRAAEDIGNSIHLEHVNVQIPDQRLAMLFYVTGLGLTRDPYLMVADSNMWINAGRSQFHLPTGEPQVLRGHTGIVIAGREALLARLASVRGKLEGTRFNFSEHNDYVEAMCPWGNRYRVYEPDAARFGRITLGFPYVELDVPVGTAHGIAAFYRAMVDTPAKVANGDGTVARIMIGKGQHLLFRETDRPLPEFDEHHIAIYVVNFSGPHGRLKARNLVNREDNQYQYRFRDIVDLDSSKHLFTIEHEVRCVTHPMFLRPLVNRNPVQTNRNYAMGHDEWRWAMDPSHYDNQS
jgi:hypothetical protein